MQLFFVARTHQLNYYLPTTVVAMPRPINGMAISTNKIFIIFAVGCSALILMNLSLGHFHHDVTNNRQHVDSSFILQNSNSINNEEQRMKVGSQEQHSNNNRQINVVDRSFTHSKSVVVDDENKWWLGKIRRPDGAPLTHPYMGARHKNGSVGLLVNPSPSRLQFVDITKVSNVICSTVPSSTEVLSKVSSVFQYGIEGKGGRRVLEKVRVAHHDESIEKVDKRSKRSRPSRILCLVYSVHLPSNGKNDQIANHANLRAIAQTWGQKCDGFIGASNVTDHSIGAVDLPHEGAEEYSNMWQKG